MSFPSVPYGLITALERQFPDKCPRSDLGTFELGKQAGIQTVIDLLRNRFETQQNKESSIVFGS